MEALLNVTQRYTDRPTPPEVHIHDVLLGDLITLEAMGQRYQVHVTEITEDTITLEVQGLDQTHENTHPFSSRLLRRFTLPRNSSLSLAIPTMDKGPTWTFEWTASTPAQHQD